MTRTMTMIMVPSSLRLFSSSLLLLLLALSPNSNNNHNHKPLPQSLLFASASSSSREETNNNFCGINWIDAATHCHLPCPSGPSGEDVACSDALGDDYACYMFTGCDEKLAAEELAAIDIDAANNNNNGNNNANDNADNNDLSSVSVTPIISNNNFCGKSWIDAMLECTNECPFGFECSDPDERCYAATNCDKPLEELASHMVITLAGPNEAMEEEDLEIFGTTVYETIANVAEELGVSVSLEVGDQVVVMLGQQQWELHVSMAVTVEYRPPPYNMDLDVIVEDIINENSAGLVSTLRERGERAGRDFFSKVQGIEAVRASEDETSASGIPTYNPTSVPSSEPSRALDQVIITGNREDLLPTPPTTSSYGYIFRVRTKPDAGVLTITGLDFYTKSTEEITFELWSRLGSFHDYKGTYDGWDSVGSGTIQGRGIGRYTSIPQEMFASISVPGGGGEEGTRSFYLTLDTMDLVYKLGGESGGAASNANKPHAESKELEVLEGEGVLFYPFPDPKDKFFYRSPRRFLGAIYYDRLPCKPYSLYGRVDQLPCPFVPTQAPTVPRPTETGLTDCAGCNTPTLQCTGTTPRAQGCAGCATGQTWWPCNAIGECYCKDLLAALALEESEEEEDDNDYDDGDEVMAEETETVHHVKFEFENVPDDFFLSDADRASVIRFIKEMLEDNLENPIDLNEVAKGGDSDSKSLTLRITIKGPADIISDSYVMEVIDNGQKELVMFLKSLDWNSFKGVNISIDWDDEVMAKETRPCSRFHDCRHGSTCVYETQNGTPYCDCSTAANDDPTNNDDKTTTLFVGTYCEYEAETYCTEPSSGEILHFCVNGGICNPSSPADCLCTEEFHGKHCEFVGGPIESEEEEEDISLIPSDIHDINTEEVMITDNYCGASWLDASATCRKPCPTGNDRECLGGISGSENFRCYYYTGCLSKGEEMTSYTPTYFLTSYTPTNFHDINTEEVMITDNYCGASWLDASATCHKPCPTGNDRECLGGISGSENFRCFYYTGCKSKLSYTPTSFLTSYTPTNFPTPTRSERDVLVRLYDQTRGNYWERNDHWTSDVSFCQWFGVQCDASFSYDTVSHLELEANSLHGQFVVDINILRDLPNLSVLNLASNGLYGSIPEEIGSPDKKLKMLKLGSNRLRGAIPSSISRLPMLEYLELRENQLSSFRISAGGYSKLRTLDLAKNQLEGTLQFNLLQMTALENVTLSGNRLVGPIPKEMSSLVNLTKLDLSSNRISGVLPGGMEGFGSRLQHLNISNNDIVALIPDDLMESSFNAALYSEYTIDLSSNGFEGTVPNFPVAKLRINVANNRLTGIDEGACLNEQWNGGNVGEYGCDAIACAAATANAQGRQVSDTTTCVLCMNGDEYIGNIGCYTDKPFPSPSPILELWQECTLQCFNGGECRKYGGGREYCECLTSYTGPQCESLSPNFYGPTPPPSFGQNDNVPSAYGSVESSDCTFYAADATGRLSSFEAFCGGGAGYADLGPLVDIAVDPSTGRAIGLREDEIFEFNARTGAILERSLVPNVGGNDAKPLLSVVEFAHGRLYMIGWLDIGLGDRPGYATMYEMDTTTLAVTSRGPTFGTQIEGLAHWSNGSANKLYGISSCNGSSDLYEINLDNKRAELVCGDLPACFESLTFHPIEDGGALYGGVEGGCIAQIDLPSCQVLGCDTYSGWSSHLDDVTGLSVSCTMPVSPSSSPTTPELESAIPKCPNDDQCQHGSECVPSAEMNIGYTCDCQSATTTRFEVYAGIYCNYKATEYCSDLYHVAEYAFCTNGGKCLQVDISPGSPHPGCSCLENFYGEHCELVDMGPTNAPTKNPEDEQTLRPSSTLATRTPASKPTLNPVALQKTFALYEIPPFLVILITPFKFLTRAPLKEVEDVASKFLLDIFNESVGVENSVYITILKAIETDQIDLLSNIRVRSATNNSDRRRAQSIESLVFLKVDGIIGIRDGLFIDLNSLEKFISSTMGKAFQLRDEMLSMLQGSSIPALQSVSLVELSDQIEICPNQIRCHHGSQCVKGGGGMFVCDCSTASPLFEAYDGLQCEFAATQFCSNASDVRSYSFCVNGGECVKSNVTFKEPHPGCMCSDPFEGSRCQLMKDFRVERSTNLVTDEDSTTSNNLSPGGLAIFIIIGIGLVLTILIIVHKINSKQRDQKPVHNRAIEPAASPAVEIEAGLADKPTTPQLGEVAPQLKDSEEEKVEIVADLDMEFGTSVQPIADDANAANGKVKQTAKAVSALATEENSSRYGKVSNENVEEELKEIRPQTSTDDISDYSNQEDISNTMGTGDQKADDGVPGADRKVPPTASSDSDEEAVAHVEDDSGNDRTLGGPIELEKV